MKTVLLQKKEGAAMPVVVLAFTVTCILLILVLANWLEAVQVGHSIKDNITLSAQSLAVNEKGLHASGVTVTARDVAFFTGHIGVEEWSLYAENPAFATREACEFAYETFLDLFMANTASLSNYLRGYEIERFCLVNVLNGTEYSYDFCTAFSSAVVATAESYSHIEIKLKVLTEFPVFGEKALAVREVVKLRER